MDKVKLSNKNGAPVTTVGELKELLVPFTDDCQLNKIQVYYCPASESSATLEIRLA